MQGNCLGWKSYIIANYREIAHIRNWNNGLWGVREKSKDWTSEQWQDNYSGYACVKKDADITSIYHKKNRIHIRSGQ